MAKKTATSRKRAHQPTRLQKALRELKRSQVELRRASKKADVEQQKLERVLRTELGIRIDE